MALQQHDTLTAAAYSLGVDRNTLRLRAIEFGLYAAHQLVQYRCLADKCGQMLELKFGKKAVVPADIDSQCHPGEISFRVFKGSEQEKS